MLLRVQTFELHQFVYGIINLDPSWVIAGLSRYQHCDRRLNLSGALLVIDAASLVTRRELLGSCYLSLKCGMTTTRCCEKREP